MRKFHTLIAISIFLLLTGCSDNSSEAENQKLNSDVVSSPTANANADESTSAGDQNVKMQTAVEP